MSFFNDAVLVNNNQLKGDICLTRDSYNQAAGIGYGTVHDINGRVEIQFMCLDVATRDTFCTTVLVSFCKLIDGDKASYRMNFNSKELQIQDKIITTAVNGFWYILHEGNRQLKMFDVNVVVEVIESQGSFSAIHDDAELTDFELSGVDGVVRVHRCVLAAASPVLRRMLSGEWREAGAGRVEVPDTTRATLQHFKDYVYLGVLPASGLRPLLLLASCYMMPELESRCVDALADTLTPNTTYDLLLFAFNNKLKMLAMKILARVKSGAVEIEDIMNHF